MEMITIQIFNLDLTQKSIMEHGLADLKVLLLLIIQVMLVLILKKEPKVKFTIALLLIMKDALLLIKLNLQDQVDLLMKHTTIGKLVFQQVELYKSNVIHS